LLRDEDAEVRAAAIATLGEISGPEAKSLLRSLTDDASAVAREAALDALSEIDLDEDPLSLRMRS
jgi:HEAT repeat protein